jgi:hypothetical protein
MPKPIYELLDRVLSARQRLEKAQAYLHVSDHRKECQTAYEDALKEFEDVFYDLFESREEDD